MGSNIDTTKREAVLVVKLPHEVLQEKPEPRSEADDEQNLSPGQKFRRRLMRAGRLFVLVVGGMYIAGYAALFFLGGKHGFLKKPLESLVSEITGYPAQIEKIDALYFVPETRIDISGLQSGPQDGPPVLSAGRIVFRTSFLNLVLQRTRYKDILVEDLNAAAGVITPRSLRINTAQTVPVFETQDRKLESWAGGGFSIQGIYGEALLSVLIAMTAKPVSESAQEYVYSLSGKDFPFEVRIGDLSFSGLRKDESGLVLDPLYIRTPDADVNGRLAYSSAGLEAELSAGGSTFFADLRMEKKKREKELGVSGRAGAKKLDLDTIGAPEGLLTVIGTLAALSGEETRAPEQKTPAAIDLSGLDLNIALSIEEILRGGRNAGALSGTLDLSDKILSMKDLRGAVFGGNLAGNLSLDASALPAKFSSSLRLTGADIPAVLGGDPEKSALSGSFNAGLKLDAQGETWDALSAKMNGNAEVIAGEGQFASGLLNLWGAGLINTLIPSLDPESETRLNCAIADFEIKDSIARSRTFFVDTKRLTLQADGAIDLNESRIDMTVTPHPKQTALLDIASAVRISGDLASPSIRPDALSFGKKLGGLFLGTVNPAFLAFSLTDLGLSDDHPCAAYIKESP